MSVRIVEEALNLEEVVREVVSPSFGAVITFMGCVRSTEAERPIASIDYQAYCSMAEKELERIVQTADKRWGVKSAIRHRVGKVSVGQASIVLACAGSHRKEVFSACQFIIEELKKHVPIWKANFCEESLCA